MPNITITIPQPVLTTGQYFKTRYRLLPSGSWSSYVNRSNAPFTLTGLSAGDYQLEAILVKANGTQCAAIYKNFTVVPDFSCLSFSASMIQSGSLYYIQITYTLPPGYTNPACGWEMVYEHGTSIVNNTYPVLPSSPILIPVANQSYKLTIYGNICNGNKTKCGQFDISPISPPPCTGIHVTSQTMFKSAGKYYITLNFTQSSPPTTTLTIFYQQTGASSPDIKTITPAILSTATSYTFQVNPSFIQQKETFDYVGWIKDVCPTATPLSVSCLV
ncbi:MAG: hypothetical protein JST82_01520 [Bacteroidetes bacterium]|nr:hypothetical protein [Bacteroidota bacterium]